MKQGREPSISSQTMSSLVKAENSMLVRHVGVREDVIQGTRLVYIIIPKISFMMEDNCTDTAQNPVAAFLWNQPAIFTGNPSRQGN